MSIEEINGQYICEDCETVVELVDADYELDNYGGRWRGIFSECRCKEIWGDAA